MKNLLKQEKKLMAKTLTSKVTTIPEALALGERQKENQMNKTYYIGLNICRYYIVHINDDGYEQKEWVPEDDINGFIQCLKALGYKEI